jgi:small neutral amino acid transporter SnatA (MarC family)
MADEDKTPRKATRTPDELTDLRRWAIKVFIILSIFVVVIDALGRLFRDPTFRVDAVTFGFVGGVLLALLGLEGINRALGSGK